MKNYNCVLAFFLILLLSANQLFSQRQAEVAIAWYEKGNKESSQTEKIKCYSKAIELVPTFIEAHYYLGHVYKNIGRYQDAVASYNNALKANPEKLNDNLKRTILFEAAVVYEKLEQYEDSERAFLSAFDLTDEDASKATIVNMLGRINISMLRFDKAISYYHKGIEIYPINKNSFESSIAKANELKNIYNNYNDGVNYLKESKYTDAVTALEKVKAVDPNFKDVTALLVESKQYLEIQNAELDLEKYYQHGLVCLTNKDWEGATEAFELVAAKSPNYQEVKNHLSFAKQNLKTKEKEEILEKFYNDGNAAVQRGDYINALIAYERVSEMDPEYKNVDFKISQILQRTDSQDNNILKARYYSQGMEAYDNGNWQEAANNFSRLYVIDNSYENVQEMMDNAKRKAASTTKAGTIEIYYQKGLDYINQENWLYAVINFEKVNMLDPNYKEAKALLAQARQNFENDQNKIVTASTAGANKTNPLLIISIIVTSVFLPFWAMVLFFPTARARLYLLQKKYDKASQIYERLLNNNPQNVKLYITLANIYINEKRKDEYAMQIFKKVIETNINESLKRQVIPIVNQHYLEQGRRINPSSLGMLEDTLREELRNMGS